VSFTWGELFCGCEYVGVCVCAGVEGSVRGCIVGVACGCAGGIGPAPWPRIATLHDWATSLELPGHYTRAITALQ